MCFFRLPAVWRPQHLQPDRLYHPSPNLSTIDSTTHKQTRIRPKQNRLLNTKSHSDKNTQEKMKKYTLIPTRREHTFFILFAGKVPEISGMITLLGRRARIQQALRRGHFFVPRPQPSLEGLDALAEHPLRLLPPPRATKAYPMLERDTRNRYVV